MNCHGVYNRTLCRFSYPPAALQSTIMLEQHVDVIDAGGDFDVDEPQRSVGGTYTTSSTPSEEEDVSVSQRSGQYDDTTCDEVTTDSGGDEQWRFLLEPDRRPPTETVTHPDDYCKQYLQRFRPPSLDNRVPRFRDTSGPQQRHRASDPSRRSTSAASSPSCDMRTTWTDEVIFVARGYQTLPSRRSASSRADGVNAERQRRRLNFDAIDAIAHSSNASLRLQEQISESLRVNTTVHKQDGSRSPSQEQDSLSSSYYSPVLPDFFVEATSKKIPCTIKELQMQLKDVQDECFKLKMNLHFLEEDYKKSNGSNDLTKENVNLKVENVHLKTVMQRKNGLLQNALQLLQKSEESEWVAREAQWTAEKKELDQRIKESEQLWSSRVTELERKLQLVGSTGSDDLASVGSTYSLFSLTSNLGDNAVVGSLKGADDQVAISEIIQEKDTLIESLKNELAHCCEQLQILNVEHKQVVKEKEQELNSLHRAVKEKDQQIQNLLSERSRMVEDTHHNMSDLMALCSAKDAEIFVLKNQMDVIVAKTTDTTDNNTMNSTSNNNNRTNETLADIENNIALISQQIQDETMDQLRSELEMVKEEKSRIVEEAEIMDLQQQELSEKLQALEDEHCLMKKAKEELEAQLLALQKSPSDSQNPLPAVVENKIEELENKLQQSEECMTALIAEVEKLRKEALEKDSHLQEVIAEAENQRSQWMSLGSGVTLTPPNSPPVQAMDANVAEVLERREEEMKEEKRMWAEHVEMLEGALKDKEGMLKEVQAHLAMLEARQKAPQAASGSDVSSLDPKKQPHQPVLSPSTQDESCLNKTTLNESMGELCGLPLDRTLQYLKRLSYFNGSNCIDEDIKDLSSAELRERLLQSEALRSSLQCHLEDMAEFFSALLGRGDLDRFQNSLTPREVRRLRTLVDMTMNISFSSFNNTTSRDEPLADVTESGGQESLPHLILDESDNQSLDRDISIISVNSHTKELKDFQSATETDSAHASSIGENTGRSRRSRSSWSTSEQVQPQGLTPSLVQGLLEVLRRSERSSLKLCAEMETFSQSHLFKLLVEELVDKLSDENLAQGSLPGREWEEVQQELTSFQQRSQEVIQTSRLAKDYLKDSLEHFQKLASLPSGATPLPQSSQKSLPGLTTTGGSGDTLSVEEPWLNTVMESHYQLAGMLEALAKKLQDTDNPLGAQEGSRESSSQVSLMSNKYSILEQHLRGLSEFWDLGGDQKSNYKDRFLQLHKALPMLSQVIHCTFSTLSEKIQDGEYELKDLRENLQLLEKLQDGKHKEMKEIQDWNLRLQAEQKIKEELLQSFKVKGDEMARRLKSQGAEIKRLSLRLQETEECDSHKIEIQKLSSKLEAAESREKAFADKVSKVAKAKEELELSAQAFKEQLEIQVKEKFDAELKKLSQHLETVNSRLKKSERRVHEQQKELAQCQSKYGNLQTECIEKIDQARMERVLVEEELFKTREKLSVQIKDHSEVEEKMELLTKELQAARSELESYSEKVVKCDAELEERTGKVTALETELNLSKEKLENSEREMSRFKEECEHLKGQLEVMRERYSQVTSNWQEAEGQLLAVKNNYQERFQELEGNWKDVCSNHEKEISRLRADVEKARHANQSLLKKLTQYEEHIREIRQYQSRSPESRNASNRESADGSSDGIQSSPTAAPPRPVPVGDLIGEMRQLKQEVLLNNRSSARLCKELKQHNRGCISMDHQSQQCWQGSPPQQSQNRDRSHRGSSSSSPDSEKVQMKRKQLLQGMKGDSSSGTGSAETLTLMTASSESSFSSHPTTSLEDLPTGPDMSPTRMNTRLTSATAPKSDPHPQRRRVSSSSTSEKKLSLCCTSAQCSRSSSETSLLHMRVMSQLGEGLLGHKDLDATPTRDPGQESEARSFFRYEGPVVMMMASHDKELQGGGESSSFLQRSNYSSPDLGIESDPNPARSRSSSSSSSCSKTTQNKAVAITSDKNMNNSVAAMGEGNSAILFRRQKLRAVPTNHHQVKQNVQQTQSTGIGSGTVETFRLQPLKAPTTPFQQFMGKLHGMCSLQDLELIRQVLNEALVILQGAKATLRNRLSNAKLSSPAKSLEYGTLREVATRCQQVDEYIVKCKNLADGFLTVQVMNPSPSWRATPIVDSSTIAHQGQSHQQEHPAQVIVIAGSLGDSASQDIGVQTEICDLTEQVLNMQNALRNYEQKYRKAMEQLKSWKNRDKQVNRALEKQLSNTTKVLSLAKGNLKQSAATEKATATTNKL